MVHIEQRVSQIERNSFELEKNPIERFLALFRSRLPRKGFEIRDPFPIGSNLRNRNNVNDHDELVVDALGYV